MAALSDEDMEKILGANYRAQSEADAKASGVENEERLIRGTIDTLEGGMFALWVTILVGIGLIVAGRFTATGQAFWIQAAVGAVIFLGGLWGLLYSRKRLAALMAEGARLNRKTAAAAASK